jgi:hypothetical protein
MTAREHNFVEALVQTEVCILDHIDGTLSRIIVTSNEGPTFSRSAEVIHEFAGGNPYLHALAQFAFGRPVQELAADAGPHLVEYYCPVVTAENISTAIRAAS